MTTTRRPTPRTPSRSPGRPLAGALAATLAGLVLGGTASPAAADDLPPGRRLVEHTVRPGETATGLAVRFHAWTAELVAHNHLGPGAALRAGQHLEIPVVVAALPHRQQQRHAAPRPASQPSSHHHSPPTPVRDPDGSTVRRTISDTAARRGVDPQLALAVSWQESGWQMDRRSTAGAIGAMQVLPTTADWMSLYVGRRLHPHRLADNSAAGVELLRVLGDQTGTRRHQVGAYYQGLGAVRDHGLLPETRHYVADVLAIKARLEAGRPPA